METYNYKRVFVLCFLCACLVCATYADPTSGCQQIELPMCKWLVGYNLTRLPNQFNHRTQSEVYWALQEWWPFMDTMCSANFRILLCGLYLPKCTPGSPRVQLPCRETCRKAKVRCSPEMQRQGRPWSRLLRCPQFLPKRTNRCIQPLPEKKKKKVRGHVSCQQNTLSMCAPIEAPFTHGSLPNMFLQNNLPLMEAEMMQYQPLIQSGCSANLRFFLCGVFMPFCVHQRQQDIPFVVPCRELCQEVYDNCREEFTRTRNGLPWPGKLHCHRYPSFMDAQNTNTSIPCTMRPNAGRQSSGLGTGTLQGQISTPQVRPTRRPGQAGRRRGPNRRQPGRRPRTRPGNRRTGGGRRANNRQGSRAAGGRRANGAANNRRTNRVNVQNRVNAQDRANAQSRRRRTNI